MPDWIEGVPFTVYELRLPKGYSIYVSVQQHQSGRVSIRRAVSRTIGFFDLTSMKLQLGDLDSGFYDKLNAMIVEES